MPNTIRMYSTQWCGDCRNAKRFLQSHNILYEETDIDLDAAAARQVIDWSGGRRVIPTFEIICEESTGNRIILHNPRLSELAKALNIEPVHEAH